MNRLSRETSPYLLQHAENPVDWYPWGQEAFDKARSESKLMLISIGYSACHWCHVMEHEVFEDFECAEAMNARFVCVKVDREEHPDVDHIYMDALHVMGQRGGWPLNVFVLPDGRPVYGGTYIPKQAWLRILDSLSELWSREPERMFEYASKVASGISQLSLISGEYVSAFDPEVLDKVVEHWSGYWDRLKGGMRKAPKFPMPVDWQFLLTYGSLLQHEEALSFAFFSLDRMAMGGIYDHVGGGFARYSVDEDWKVPHFEKMLYDNAQLLTVYAQAYSLNPSSLYRRVIEETTGFIERDWKSAEGLYFSASDADSEGEEGKYYVWKADELREVLGEDFDWASAWFALDENGLWEHGNFILLRTTNDEGFCREHSFPAEELDVRLSQVRGKLDAARSSRVKPGIDHKCLLSWNAMLVPAWCEAYRSTGAQRYLDLAKELMLAIDLHFFSSDGLPGHQFTSGKRSEEGYADDYAFYISALVAMGRTTGEETYFIRAAHITDQMIGRFFDKESGYFRLSPVHEPSLLFASKTEISDNVVPAVNSEMCVNLLLLSHLMERPEWEELSSRMLGSVLPVIDFASGYTNWLRAYVLFTRGIAEVVCVGTEKTGAAVALSRIFRPDVLVLSSTGQSELPAVNTKAGQDPGIYVCRNKTCHAPVQTPEEALTLIS